MRSIRRSMTVYLLLLLVVTIGVTGWVIDRRTAQSLEARELAAIELVEARVVSGTAASKVRHDEQRREEEERLKQALLLEAQGLAGVMQREYYNRYNLELRRYLISSNLIVPLLGANPLTQTAWTGGLNHWIGPNPYNREPSPTAQAYFRWYFSNLPIPDEYLQQTETEGLRATYFQINTVAGRVWHSRHLDGHSLPFDPKPLESNKLIDWDYDEVNLSPGGERVYRVILKAPLFNVQPPRPPRGPGPGAGPRPGWPPLNPPLQPVQPPPPPSADTLPKIYVQAAIPAAHLDAAFTRFAAERDAELAALRADREAAQDKVRGEVHEERRRLRFAILGSGVLAFLALALGGPLLVGRGLAPIGKLSVAVSEVSEKDFNLPHDGKNLPTELVPIHARITQTLDQLRRAFAREKQSVADISHELRTPIASLLATIDVTLRKPRTPEQYRHTLEECRAITRQLGQLVERIMTLASLDAGTTRTVSVRTDGVDVAAACVTVIRPIAEAQGLTLDSDTSGPLELDTDPDKLREILVNLLHNAVEYNRPGGRIELSGRVENGSIVFEVRDTGIGMTPDVKGRIFERFYRADASRNAAGVHAGLGLAIVNEYVERLNGTIEVESEPGVGTTFRVSFPEGPDNDDAPLVASAGSGRPGRQ